MDHHEDLKGKKFGHYILEEKIAEGGIIYRAKDTRLLRHVAIKTLNLLMAKHFENALLAVVH